MITAIIFVIAWGIEGCGGAIYFALGTTYIDDNVRKSQAPLLFCIASFVRLLAPAFGYSLASYVLKIFIAPSLHPKINDEDPRWIGAWWIGYIVFAIIMFTLAPIICTFPKILPRGALRKKEELMKKMENIDKMIEEENSKATMKGLE